MDIKRGRLNSGYSLKVEPTGFVNEINISYKAGSHRLHISFGKLIEWNFY